MPGFEPLGSYPVGGMPLVIRDQIDRVRDLATLTSTAILIPESQTAHGLLDGVTGRPRRKPLARYSAIEGASLAASCATAVVPQTDGVILTGVEACPLQASSRDDHEALCRNRRVFEQLQRMRG